MGTIYLTIFSDLDHSKSPRISDHYLRNFVTELRARGREVITCDLQKLMFQADPPAGSIVILVIDDVTLHEKLDENLGRLAVYSRFALAQRLYTVHSFEMAMVLASPRATHAVLADNGVPVPALVTQAINAPVLSKPPAGESGGPVVLAPGTPIDPLRSNIEFVDCCHVHNGRPYYVCLRALCVGPNVSTVYVRARDAAEGVELVRSARIPPEVALIQDLHNRFVEPNRDQIDELAQEIYHALGFGFLSFDILVSSAGQLFVGDVAFRCDDPPYEAQMAPIRNEHPNKDLFDGVAGTKAARLFLSDMPDGV